MLNHMPQDRYVQVNGLRARFWAVGEEGPEVVLIHGLGASVETWKDNIHARVAQAGIPGAQDHIFDRCGHMPQMEHPAEFNALVREFLAE